MEYKIFVAWQSQNKAVNQYIKSQLRKSQKLLLNEKKIKTDIIFSPTQDESGSPNISEKIFEHIITCDVFVGDLTPIYEFPDGKLISNPNVMYETGIAITLIGENRTILLMESNNNQYTIDNLCFDINHNRITPILKSDSSLFRNLSEWLMMAINNSIAQRFTDEFILKDTINDLVVVYNNIFRMLYPYTDYYPLRFNQISLSDIYDKLSNGYFNAFQIKKDYSSVLNRISKNINSLNTNNRYKKLVNELIQFINLLNDYNDINLRSKFSCFEIYKIDNDSVYGLMDQDGVILNSIENYDDIKDSLVFRKDTFILTILGMENSTTPSGSMFDIYLKDSINYAVQEVTEVNVNWGSFISPMKGVHFYRNIPIYKFKDEESLRKYSDIFFNIINCMNNILKILKLTSVDIIHGTDKQGYLITFDDSQV